MKVGIDLTPVEDAPAGIGNYTINILSELLKLVEPDSIVTYSTTKRYLPGAENIVIKKPKYGPAKGLRWMRRVAMHAKQRKLDAFISPSSHLFTWFFPRTVQYIHDLAPVFYKRYFPRKAFLYRITAKIAVKYACKILTVSESVKQEIIDWAGINPAKIAVIYPGLSSKFKRDPANLEEVRDLYNLPSKYLLSVATLEPRKNHLNTIRAFASAHKNDPELKLVIVGKKGWYYDQIFAEVQKLGMEQEILFLGYVDDANLSAVYELAAGFVYFSFYEGFGIPPLEAMYFDLPVLLSDIPVFREVFSEGAVFVNPDNPEKIAQNMQKILKEGKISHGQILQRFTWEAAAQKLLDEIRTCIKK